MESRKSKNSKIDEEREDQDEEKLRKSFIVVFARRNREEHTMLAEVGEEEADVICIIDVTSKELPWHEVRKAREQELKCFRDLRVFENVDEREAIAQYQVTPVDTKWIDTNKAFEEEPMQIRSRIVAREFKSRDSSIGSARAPTLEKVICC